MASSKNFLMYDTGLFTKFSFYNDQKFNFITISFDDEPADGVKGTGMFTLIVFKSTGKQDNLTII